MLYSFCPSKRDGCPDGAGPEAGLILDSSGNLFGTAAFGGIDGGGTLFELTAGGSFQTLYSFCSLGGCADGAQPADNLVMDPDANLYGTTMAGGVNGQGGTVFELTP